MAVKEVEEIDDDFTVDEDDYTEDEVVEATIVESETTSTKNFMSEDAVVVDEIQDLGVVVVDPEQADYIVRVIVDVGPVFYGQERIEMKRGHRYRVPPHIYDYLQRRDLLWEQQ
jgi:hypothetical protein